MFIPFKFGKFHAAPVIEYFFPHAVTAPGVLDVAVVYVDPKDHCCEESSDEECLAKDGSAHDLRKNDPPGEVKRWLVCHTLRKSTLEASSGYSSVSSASSPPATNCDFGAVLKTTSARLPGPAKNQGLPPPQDVKSCLPSVCARPGEKSDRRQVKRKNVAKYSEAERMNLGFISL